MALDHVSVDGSDYRIFTLGDGDFGPWVHFSRGVQRTVSLSCAARQRLPRLEAVWNLLFHPFACHRAGMCLCFSSLFAGATVLHVILSSPLRVCVRVVVRVRFFFLFSKFCFSFSHFW